MNDMGFKDLKNEVMRLLDKNKFIVLATCSKKRVTARTMSYVNDGLTLYFQTDKNFIKYRQIQDNKLVALCLNNIQIEGIAEIKGHPMDPDNHLFLKLFKRDHLDSLNRYTHLKNEILIKVYPQYVTIWKYEDAKAFRDFLDLKKEEAFRKFYI